MTPASDPPRTDLRLVVVGAAAWAGTLAGLAASGGPLLAGLAVAGGLAALVRRRPERLAWVLVAAALAGSAYLRAEAVRSSPVADLARQRASVSATVVLRGDGMLREGRFSRYVVARGTATVVTGRGRSHRVRAPVLLLAPSTWAGVRFGERVVVRGRLAPADEDDLAGVVSVRGPPAEVTPAAAPLRGLERVRAGIRRAVAPAPPAPRALVPALVVGDDSGFPADVADDFRTAGLTHLLAVSGTNLTLVVGCWLVLVRGCGVRARGLMVAGLVGIVGFVLLARPEPSVLRAAAMGGVALLGLGSNGRERGLRGLGAAVVVLLAVNPWLARTWGFALSASATAGILFLAPPWRDALARWLPRWAAEAVAVPIAAQLACTPLVVALSGRVSLVAVAANLLAAPAVGPATVLGLAGGLVATVSEPLAQVPGTGAAWSAAWIVGVARRCARLPVADLGWAGGPGALLALTLLCVLVGLLLGAALARRTTTLALALGCGVLVAVPLPSPGWPPPGWVMVACDVGQGDGLVLRPGTGSAVVVDAGPDPAAVDRCLQRLGVQSVPLVVLSHFHADHVDGLAGVLDGRDVGAVEVTALADPLDQVRAVRAAAAAHDVPVRVGGYGERGRAGALRWELVAPSGPVPADSGSPPNDASLVLVVRTRGLTLLLLGDEEPPAQARLHRELPGLRADVLKVAHHGSRHQDADLLRGLGARLAVVSVGADNDYGHPAPETTALLREAGMTVARTDRDGDVAVVVDDEGRLRLRTRR